MITNVFTNTSIKEDNPMTTFNLQESPREEMMHLNSSGEVKIPTTDNIFAKVYSHLDVSMAYCDVCGLLFESVSDLQRYIKTSCPDNGKRKLPLDNYKESLEKKPRVFQSDYNIMNHEIDSYNTSTEKDYFKRLRQTTKSENENTWSLKVEKYQSNGLPQKRHRKESR